MAKEAGVASNSVARWERDEMQIRETAARLIKRIAAGTKKKKS
jgi:DNA-binding transcriptional regulator YiaG